MSSRRSFLTLVALSPVILEKRLVSPADGRRWPRKDVYNPLIVEFFSAPAYRASNDMIAWCAAFVNWCVERSNRTGRRSPASQSFLNQKIFKQVTSARVGDLVVFTCHRVTDDL